MIAANIVEALRAARLQYHDDRCSLGYYNRMCRETTARCEWPEADLYAHFATDMLVMVRQSRTRLIRAIHAAERALGRPERRFR